MTALVLLLASFQSNPEDLIIRLGDESIEIREGAAADLLKLGEAAREAVVKGISSSDPEIRSRSKALLEVLDLHRELRPWIVDPIRVTVVGERTLKEAVEEFEKQTGVKVTTEWPENRFEVDVRNAPMWEALDAICKASRMRTLSLTSQGPKLIGRRWEPVPTVYSRNFMIRFDSVKTTKTRSFDGGNHSSFFSLVLAAGWPRPVSPVRSRLALVAVEDDLGQSLLEGFNRLERDSHMVTTLLPAKAEPAYAMLFPKPTAQIPLPTSTHLRKVEGNLSIWIRASPRELEMSLPGPGTARIEILGTTLATVNSADVALLSSDRQGEKVTCTIELTGFEEWMIQGLENPWALSAKDGRIYQGVVRTRKRTFDSRKTLGFGIEFVLPESTEPDSFILRVPRKVVAIDVPFLLRDIPLK